MRWKFLVLPDSAATYANDRNGGHEDTLDIAAVDEGDRARHVTASGAARDEPTPLSFIHRQFCMSR